MGWVSDAHDVNDIDVTSSNLAVENPKDHFPREDGENCVPTATPTMQA